MKAVTLLRRGALITLLLLTGLILITAVVNLPVFDEQLNPELASMMHSSHGTNPEGNAYVAIWGLNAVAGRDMVDAGKRLVERNQENLNNKGLDALSAQDYQEILGANDTKEAWLNDFNCSARTTLGCLSSVQSNLENMDLESDRSQSLIARHQRILQMQTFANWTDNSFTYSAPFPPYGLVLQLSLVKLGWLSDSGSSAEFIEQLSLDMHFWRMMLAGGSELIDKMFGIAGIWNDLQLLSDYMATHELSETERQTIASLLQPLTRSELNIGSSFIAEQRSVFNTLNLILDGKKPADLGALINSWLIQPGATQNSYYENMTKPLLHLSALSRAEFAANTHLVNGFRRSSGHDGAKQMSTVWPGTPYNIGGKIYLKLVSGYPSAYIARVHDLNSMIALVKLQLNLQSEDAEPLANILASKDLQEQGIKYEREEGWLGFDCLYGRRSICKIELYETQ